MGTLKRNRGDGRLELPPRVLVGRSDSMQLLLEDSQASREHAVIWWEDGAWRLRDLNSLNGTWLDGRRLSPSIDIVLRAGHQLSFGGGAETWTVESTAPPGAEESTATPGAEGALGAGDADL